MVCGEYRRAWKKRLARSDSYSWSEVVATWATETGDPINERFPVDKTSVFLQGLCWMWHVWHFSSLDQSQALNFELEFESDEPIFQLRASGSSIVLESFELLWREKSQDWFRTSIDFILDGTQLDGCAQGTGISQVSLFMCVSQTLWVYYMRQITGRNDRLKIRWEIVFRVRRKRREFVWFLVFVISENTDETRKLNSQGFTLWSLQSLENWSVRPSSSIIIPPSVNKIFCHVKIGK